MFDFDSIWMTLLQAGLKGTAGWLIPLGFNKLREIWKRRRPHDE